MCIVNISAFIKFGSEKNILDLYENGTIYCNTVEYFRKLDGDLLRGDNHEGTFKITNFPPGSKITLKLPKDREMEIETARLHLREFYTNIKGNIYCLTALTREEIIRLGSLKLDSRNARFGTHFLFIKDNKLFFDRLIAGFEEVNLKIMRNFVKYYDKHLISGELDIFHKSNEFEYQKEFRIVIKNDEQNPIKIQIGSLKGISQIFESKELETFVCQYRSR